jgi:hypothetical protein
MKKLTEELAREAGFAFWKDESWGPGPNKIDWSGDYEKELEQFVELIVAECVDAVEQSDTHHAATSFTVSIAQASKAKAIKSIKDKFYG